MTTIQALGRITVHHEGRTTELAPASQQILALLVAAGPQGLSDERLADGLWPDIVPDGWKATVRQTMSRMNRAIPVEAIRSGGRHYALDLPLHEVDVWKLLDHWSYDLADPFQISDAELISWLTDVPYPKTDHGQVLRDSIDEITAARIEILNRILNAPKRITPRLRAALQKLINSTWDEDVVRAIVDLHVKAGMPANALGLLIAATTRIEAEIGPVGAALHERYVELANQPGLTDQLVDNVSTLAARWVGTPAWRPRTSLLPRDELVERCIAHLDAGQNLLVTGDAGTGKTVLTHRVATLRHNDGDGRHVIWIVAQRGGTTGFGPILAVFPGLIDVLDEMAESTEAQRWRLIMTHIRMRCADRPITLVVDDAQWLDSQSMQFIEFWSRSAQATDLELIVIGRPDLGDDSGTHPELWALVRDRLLRSGLAEIVVEHFSLDELVALISLHHPTSTSSQRADLAVLMVAQRAALPVLAADLIARADPATLALPHRESATDSWSDTVWAAAVGPATLEVARAAALIGVTFRVGELVELTSYDVQDIGDATDELLDAELIIGHQQPDQFSFRHVLVQQAFANAMDRREAREFRARAARWAHENGHVHERARHLLGLGPTVDVEQLAGALITSADEHLAARSFLEAVHAYEAADRVSQHALDARTLTHFTHALERSGGAAAEVRGRAFRAAVAADDPALMVRLLVDGSDVGELLEPTSQRAELLMQVPRDRLSAPDQLRLDVVLCRELAVTGDLDEARRVYLRIDGNSADDQAQAWLALWGFFVGSPPSIWPQLAVTPEEIVDDLARSRVRYVECVRLIMLGDRVGFDAQLDAVRAEPASISHPLRQWHVGLIESMQASLDGERSRSRVLASEAFATGQQFGFAGAFAAHTAQVFAGHWLCSRHGDLVPLLDAAAPDVTDSLLAQAARASALFTLDDRIDEALDLAEHLAVQSESNAHLFAPAIAVLLADADEHLPAPLRSRFAKILQPFDGHAVLVSSGLAHLGPATRALGLLADNDDERVALLRRSVAEADAWQLPVWSVRCRLDLARVLGDDTLIDEARDLARSHGELFEMFFE